MLGIITSDAGVVTKDAILPITCGLFFFTSVSFLVLKRFALRTELTGMFLLLAIAGCGAMLAINAKGSVQTGLLRYADFKPKLIAVGVVNDIPKYRIDRVSFSCTVLSLETNSFHIPLHEKTLVYYGANTYDTHDRLKQVALGDTLRMEGTLGTPQMRRNPFGFDFRGFLVRQGFTTIFNVRQGKGVIILSHDKESTLFQSMLVAVHGYIQAGIDALYSGDQADLMNGLLLGDRGRIREEISNAFRDAGIIHILAVSGLHVGIILAMIWTPLGRFRFGLRITLASTLLIGYAFITGSAPPVYRAVLMGLLLFAGMGFQRNSNPVNSLAVAAMIILFLNPMTLFQASFQLSFSAVLSILFFHQRVERFFLRRAPKWAEKSLTKYFITLLAMTFAAQIGTLPLLVYFFGQVSLVSFVANLVVIPLVFVVVASGFPAVLLAGIALPLAELFAATSSFCLARIIDTSTLLSSLSFAVIRLDAVPWLWLLCYVFCLLYVFNKPGRILQKLFIATTVCLTVVFLHFKVIADPTTENILRVTFLDVGQGDATLLEFPNGTTLLIDCGPVTSRFDTGEKTILSFFRAKGISKLDALVLTHPDNDHIGGAISLLSALAINRIYFAGKWKLDEKLQFRTDSAMMHENARVRDIRAGDSITLDPHIRILVLSPPREPEEVEASNNTSIVLKVEYGAISYLFTGDAERDAETEMVRTYGDALQSDVYKVGHHGSTTSSTPAFILKVKPRIAVISCGRLNRFNHPRQEILTRLQLVGASVFRTDLDGAIILESDGRIIRKVSWR